MKLEPMNIVCPVCGNGNYMRHLIGENVEYYNVGCLNCNSYFNLEEIFAEASDGKDINVTTNADRIRNMTDEELAKFFDCEACLFPWCDMSCGDIEEIPCRKCILKWLKQEVSK